jgi:competence protein CoiA
MALYALDSEKIVSALDSSPGKQYWCLECRKPVKMRRGQSRIPHFYHLKLSPSCRLYSKSEDHLLIQLQLQSLLPPNETQIERLFPEIHRISDLVWEPKRLAFEIQCSPIYPKEVERRIDEYRTLGYQVIWLLDDRAYNKRILRPAETLLRTLSTYYVAFRRHTTSLFYDQFEIFSERARIAKSKRFPIDLSSPYLFPKIEPPPHWPLQILNRAHLASHYFPGDLLQKALASAKYFPLSILLDHWAMLERSLPKKQTIKTFLGKLLNPIDQKLDEFLLSQ